MANSADGASAAFFEVLNKIAEAHPDGRRLTGQNGTFGVITGALVPALNGVFNSDSYPDSVEIDRLAAVVAEEGLPWSISTRREPSLEVLNIAARHGLMQRRVEPLMVCQSSDARLRGPRNGAPMVHVITASQRETYFDLLDANFGARAGIFRSLMEPIIDPPWASAYMAELNGIPVVTGYGVRTRDYIGVFNISVAPEFRGRGYGRLMTERVMQEGFDAGATTAFLQASTDGYPLYQSMGFLTVESWTYLS